VCKEVKNRNQLLKLGGHAVLGVTLDRNHMQVERSKRLLLSPAFQYLSSCPLFIEAKRELAGKQVQFAESQLEHCKNWN
jgi:hypothetical protein